MAQQSKGIFRFYLDGFRSDRKQKPREPSLHTVSCSSIHQPQEYILFPDCSWPGSPKSAAVCHGFTPTITLILFGLSSHPHSSFPYYTKNHLQHTVFQCNH